MSDLIDRQEAIDALRYTQHRFTVADEAGGIGTVKWSEDVIYFAAAEKVLADLPSAQPERPKGEWVGVHAYCDHLNEEAKVNGRTDRYFPSGMMIGVYCNQCWCRADKKSDFCPNCGSYNGCSQDG